MLVALSESKTAGWREAGQSKKRGWGAVGPRDGRVYTRKTHAHVSMCAGVHVRAGVQVRMCVSTCVRAWVGYSNACIPAYVMYLRLASKLIACVHECACVRACARTLGCAVPVRACERAERGS
eukprot:6206261-Pleurochrysis_carterae.AAC.2